MNIKTIAIAVMLNAAASTAQAEGTIYFADNFESDQGWGIFEEVVGGSSCYTTGAAQVARSPVMGNGTLSLSVWANQSASRLSNHVLANKKIATVGQAGTWTYFIDAMIPLGTGTSPATCYATSNVPVACGEVGPEMSLQNTRYDASSGRFLTTTAGIQYRANPYSPLYASWAVWAEAGPGWARWFEFRTQALTPGAWYKIGVEADFTTNKYRRMWLTGNGVNLSIDLSAYSIAREDKGFREEAVWITAESENLYNNCGSAGVFDYKVHYDNAVVAH